MNGHVHRFWDERKFWPNSVLIRSTPLQNVELPVHAKATLVRSMCTLHILQWSGR
jgi:hypothetical protein